MANAAEPTGSSSPVEHSLVASSKSSIDSHVGPIHGFGHAFTVTTHHSNHGRVITQAPEFKVLPNKTLTRDQEALLHGSEDGSVSMTEHSKNVLHSIKKKDKCARRLVTTEHSGPIYGRNNRVATLPPGIDLHNVIDPENLLNFVDNDYEVLHPKRLQLAPPFSNPISSYTLRNRGEKQGRLVYDLKYHPMDDSIRPSQAARRRLAHGEVLLLSDDTCDSSSEQSLTETVSPIGVDEESELEEAPRKVTGGKKRKLTHMQASKPTRRSSCKTSDVKTAYNMDIHPQDEALEMSGANDSETELLSHRRRKVQRTRPISESESDGRISKSARSNHQGHHIKFMDLASSDDTAVDKVPICFNGEHLRDDMEINTDHATAVKKSSLVLPVVTPQLPSIQRKEELNVWKLLPGDRYFRHNQDSWVISPGQLFEIFEERLEEQLAAEAMALSPLNYEHDDKENNITGRVLDSMADSPEEMSVLPASQYVRSSESDHPSHRIALTRQGLYDASDGWAQPYMLGGTDGTCDGQTIVQSYSSRSDHMRISAADSHLPQSTA
ncbi:Nn.00g114280.m01.CDS01 [Neocucurbitaria sp. VM-36]